MASLKLSAYDFELPPELIAQEPAPQRDASRLMVLERATGTVRHRLFRDLAAELRAGDLLVLNDTKVMPARLFAQRASGARIEVLLLEETAPDRWLAMMRPGRKAPEGTVLTFAPGFVGSVVEIHPEGLRELQLEAPGGVKEAIALHGALPLPPYIGGMPSDPGRYQTVFAREEGAVAAPTAGLHFTPELLAALASRGVGHACLTLHVGIGTFKPVMTEDLRDHVMHAERLRVSPELVATLQATRARGGRVIAVGTTVARALEHAARSGTLQPHAGETRIFITPGFRFRVVDALITNFHLPRSTLLMLVSAFAQQGEPPDRDGRRWMLECYATAIRERYRFFSFGDATLML